MSDGMAHGGGEAPHRLVWSILVTIFCCLPLGIPAIVFSAMAMSANGRGDYAEAWSKAEKAKTWIWVSFGAGLLVIIINVVLSFMGAGFAAASGSATP